MDGLKLWEINNVNRRKENLWYNKRTGKIITSKMKLKEEIAKTAKGL